MKFIKESIPKTKTSNILITEIKRVHIKLILEKTQQLRNWSNKSYNKNLGYLKAILSELIQWDIIEHNPSHGIKSLKVGEVTKFTPASDDEVTKIKEKILSDFLSFYAYIITIFNRGIRPEELLHIQIRMINLEKSQIVLPSNITKTDREPF